MQNAAGLGLGGASGALFGTTAIKVLVVGVSLILVIATQPLEGFLKQCSGGPGCIPGAFNRT